MNMSTTRVRYLLRYLREHDPDYRICAAHDIAGPGGGVYITAQTELDERHLAWLERRNPVRGAETDIEVIFCRAGTRRGRGALPAPAEATADQGGRQEEGRQRAESLSCEVGSRAEAVARHAEQVYRAISKPDFTVADLRRGEVEGGLREFEQRIGAFHRAVRLALDEYLSGNTLVMDLILRYQLDRKAVRHALNVAAFATETTAQLALDWRTAGAPLEAYFGAWQDEPLEARPPAEADAESEGGERSGREARFHEELAEIFLGGFMHDCGLWNEPFCLDEGHEAKGAKLVWELREVQRYAPALVKIVLFHSDILRLATRCGVLKVVESPEDTARLAFRREFFRTAADARTAAEVRPADSLAVLLTEEDLRKVIPVALAERYVTQTQDLMPRSRWEVIGDLARYVRGGPFLHHMVALCNAQLEVIAPRRAYAELEGTLSITTHDRKEVRRAMRLDVSGLEAVSLYHGPDRNSPHLISLFIRRPDGSRERAGYVAPASPELWERSAGAESRMYIPAGRFRNNLALRVTGFVSEEVYGKYLDEYERELRLRLG
ncbi:MAG: hypothetical protein AB1505_15350 [Candidatus Latescibacterota bacterium]